MLLIHFMSRLLSSYYTNKYTGLRHCASSTSLLKHNPIRRHRTESLIPLQTAIFSEMCKVTLLLLIIQYPDCAIANSRKHERHFSTTVQH